MNTEKHELEVWVVGEVVKWGSDEFGLGFLVFVIVFAVSLLFNFLFNAWYGEDYYTTRHWPLALSFLVSALIVRVVGNVLRKRQSRVVMDKATGQEFVLNQNDHSLFFIQVYHWAPILAGIALILLIMEFAR